MWSVMDLPGGLLLFLIFPIFTGSTSATLVTSCDLCHGDATCLELRDRGDTFSSQTLSCLCKDGFIGDGITCYSTKLCSDSSCCSQGYHWHPDKGCIDTDECSLPDSPCAPPKVCQNTQGSFKCLDSSFSAGSGPASPLIQFACGNTLCPVGMDCISDNGNSRCADPCNYYTVLDDYWRSPDTTVEQKHCDRSVSWQGWYRMFLGNSDAQIPDTCVEEGRCGTHAPMWIKEPHPTQPGEIVSRTVCSSFNNDCCNFNPHNIHVKLCHGNYYVYKLVEPSTCSLAYCAVPPNSTVLPTTPDPRPPTVTITPTSPVEDSTSVEGQVRLANGRYFCTGRVEIFHDGQWGTVCDNSWDMSDAHVVCRQLGCGSARSALPNAPFGPGTGQIWLDDVACTGRESMLTECQHPGFGSHNCGHSEDAAVVCEAAIPVRLVNSNNRCSGRVEIYQYGQWGTVCDDGWSMTEAEVVCRQVGCGRAQFAPTNAVFGPGPGPIWLDNVYCNGNEPDITQCRHLGIGAHDCNHQEDVGVVCEIPPKSTVLPTTPDPRPPTVTIKPTSPVEDNTSVEGQVRLANGRYFCTGRVEIFHDGQWGTVCDNSWDMNDAHVVCRQLGCGSARSALPNAPFGPGTGQIWLDDVACTGRELKLTECQHPGFGSHNCGHSEDAAVVCEAAIPVRLVNSNNRCSGRVEIYQYGQWGTVCDDGWSMTEAQVVCRQVGCGRAQFAPTDAAFGPGSGPIWLDNVYCNGNEPDITQCRHLGIGAHDCNHHEDAGVVCEIQDFLQQASQLLCENNKLQVGVNLDITASLGLNPLSGHLAAGSCPSIGMHNNSAWYEVEAVAGACGNILRTNQTHAIYSNTLFIYPENNGSFAIPESHSFSCAYPLNTDTSLNAARPSALLNGGLSGSGTKPRTSMSLFRNSNFTEPYTASTVTLSLGAPLYVGVSLDKRDSSFAVVLEDCYTTYSSNPYDPVRNYLIHNKCPTDRRQVSVVENGSSLQARFSALFFLIQGEYRDVFLHCSLNLCDRRNYNCVPSCRSRGRRSAPNSVPMKPVTIGPITWERGQE